MTRYSKPLMCYLGKRLLTVSLLILSAPNLCLAAELFSSQQQKDAFLVALSKQDERYDPDEQMIRRPFSSPGYHTTLKGGYVHPTRDSLNYAVALLDSGQVDRLKRAEQILRRVISLQDQSPESRTYGIWSWFAEEPLEKMSPPDWNWADFCGTQLLQIAIDHSDRLDADLQSKVRESILHAGRAIKRRNVGPGYTNIAVMGAYVTLVAGEHFDDRELADYGKARLKRFYDHTFAQSSFSEYNSPTYSIVAITELSRMLRHVKDAESRRLLRELNRFAWSHVARHFHAPSGQWAGPHSRCYATLLRDSTRAFIQRASDGQLSFLPEATALESLNAHRTGTKCPPDLLGYFTSLGEPRVEVETFAAKSPETHDIIGTTYLHTDYTLGSVNIGDLWNQRRPLLAYWKTEDGVVAMRLRCLHDDYDYSSASIFTVQDKGDILGSVVFATDRGDTHISLDRLKDASIRARDLRLRLQFEGTIDNLELPARGRLNQPIKIASGPVNVNLQIARAVFADNPVSVETTRDAIDVVLYEGPRKNVNFAELKEAAVVFALTVSTGQEPIETNQLSITNDQSIIQADFSASSGVKMSLTIPAKPLATKDQRKAASAKLNSANPWKAAAPRRR
ncbi:MAG: hypothetical protein ACYTDV_05050 [Planctomycetota bacterium]|jgi:hypothetical protein